MRRWQDNSKLGTALIARSTSAEEVGRINSDQIPGYSVSVYKSMQYSLTTQFLNVFKDI